MTTTNHTPGHDNPTGRDPVHARETGVGRDALAEVIYDQMESLGGITTWLDGKALHATLIAAGWTRDPAPAGEVERLQAERDVLAQAIHDARGILGFDNDGDIEPHLGDGLNAYGRYAAAHRREAAEHREDYEAACDRQTELRIDLDAARAEVVRLTRVVEAVEGLVDGWLSTAKEYPYQTIRIGDAHDHLRAALGPVSGASVDLLEPNPSSLETGPGSGAVAGTGDDRAECAYPCQCEAPDLEDHCSCTHPRLLASPVVGHEQKVRAEAIREGWLAAVEEARSMGKVKNEAWFFDALATRAPSALATGSDQ